MDKHLPHDLEAERAVLGAIMLDNDAYLSASRRLVGRSFYGVRNRAVWEAMAVVQRSGANLDPVTIGSELKRRGVAEPAKALRGLTDAVATAANIDHYIEIVAKKAQTRDVIRAASSVVQSGMEDPADLGEFLGEARKALAASFDAVSTGREPVPLSHGVAEVIETACSGTPPAEIIPTGFAAIDRVVGGIWSPLLHVIAGRTSMGKSVFLLNLAINLALRGLRVLYYTLEDSIAYQTRRALARLADVNMTQLVNNSVPPGRFGDLVTAGNLLSTLPLTVLDAPATSDQVINTAAMAKARGGLDVLMIDHLGYVSDRGQSEYEINSAAIRRFAQGGKDLDMPVLLAVQLNREVETRSSKRPILADLRGSGRIEEDARVVWFAFRPGYYKPEDESLEHNWELIIAKAAHGPTGKVDLWCDLPKMFIRDVNVPGTDAGDGY